MKKSRHELQDSSNYAQFSAPYRNPIHGEGIIIGAPLKRLRLGSACGEMQMALTDHQG